MKTFRPFILCAAILAGAMFSSAAPTAPAGDRYLLIVETAKPMKRELSAVQQCVRSLLASGMSGQLQRGDTLGMWTYNDELHAGDFPMQVWQPDAAAAIAKRMDEFLGKQRCQGEARITWALAALFPVIEDSDRITVLIFSDGFEPVLGTPFDGVINQVFTQHREELHNVRIPFVTVLQAVGGKIIHCTVNSASGPINIPALPKPAPVVVVPKPVASLPAVAPVIVKTNPPLILDYSKTASNAPRPAPEKVVAPVKPVAAPAPAVVATVVKEPLNSTNDRSAPAPPKPAPAAVVVAPPALPPLVVRTEVPPVIPPVAPVRADDVKPAAEIPLASAAVVSTSAPTPTNLPPPAGATAPTEGASAGWIWLVAGLAGLGLVAGGMVWRARSAPRVSAITESIERRKR